MRSFDRGWKFHKGDVRAAQVSDFDDSGWRKLDLPHDWSIESKFHPRAAGGWRGGYAELGTGWYRKRFEAPADKRAQKAYIEFDGVSILDANGVVVPGASHKITFDVSGAGRLRAVDNGDLASAETYTGTSRSAYYGRCMAIVQSGRRPGRITVKASADGLETAEVTLECR